MLLLEIPKKFPKNQNEFPKKFKNFQKIPKILKISNSLEAENPFGLVKVTDKKKYIIK